MIGDVGRWNDRGLRNCGAAECTDGARTVVVNGRAVEGNIDELGTAVRTVVWDMPERLQEH